MTGVVITTFNRNEQLKRTIDSITGDDFFIVVVNDGGEIPEDDRFTLINLPPKEHWRDSSVAFNTGIKKALEMGATNIIIQNAECMHWGDVVNYSKNKEHYIAFGCLSIGEDVQHEDIGSLVESINYPAVKDGDTAWYNHPVYRPVGYHFCAAVSSENMVKLNGFDERFSDGIGFDDDYLIHRVRALGLEVEITTDPVVIHQWHDFTKSIDNFDALVERNHQLFQFLKTEQFRAEHLYTPDL